MDSSIVSDFILEVYLLFSALNLHCISASVSSFLYKLIYNIFKYMVTIDAERINSDFLLSVVREKSLGSSPGSSKSKNSYGFQRGQDFTLSACLAEL